jgi:MSHA biogenesis protein MshM
MPYLAHFGLRDHPFSLTPDVDYYYPTQENANIIASLHFALRRDCGIVKIVGEAGTGKTLLCRLLVNTLIEKRETIAYISAPQADERSVVMAICEEFGISAEAAGASPHAALHQFLVDEQAKGRLAVVIVDEAQRLGKEGLEAIRLLSNLETDKRKLLQIVLFGQTELDALLTDPALRQLNQRVVFSFSTKPLTMAETKRYILHRIKVSHGDMGNGDVFTAPALEAIAQNSQGIPRIANVLADKSLLVAFSEGAPIVQRWHAREAVKDTRDLASHRGLVSSFAWWATGVGRRQALGIALTIVLLAGALGAWHALQREPEKGAAAAASPALLAVPAVVPAEPGPSKAASLPDVPLPRAAEVSPSADAAADAGAHQSPGTAPMADPAPPPSSPLPEPPPQQRQPAANDAPGVASAPATVPASGDLPAPTHRRAHQAPAHQDRPVQAKVARQPPPATEHAEAPARITPPPPPANATAANAPPPSVPVVPSAPAVSPVPVVPAAAPAPAAPAAVDSGGVEPAHPGVYPGGSGR